MAARGSPPLRRPDSPAAEPSSDTKERILDAGERLFAERGFQGTSLRAVTSAADVNLAAVHYHFGSKEELLHAVVDRHIRPINQERLRRLDALEAAAGQGALELRAVVEAFYAPALSDLAKGVPMRAVIGSIYHEPLDIVRPLLRGQFAELSLRFYSALQRCLPDVPAAEVHWRFQFMIGILTHILSGNPSIAPEPVSSEPGDPAALIERIVAFATEGMRAPVAVPSAQEVRS